MIAGWKPIIFLVKGSKPNIVGDFIPDVIESKPPDKSLNDWVQSTVEAEYLISKLTVENQVVFDPMMGHWYHRYRYSETKKTVFRAGKRCGNI
jgi:hypothetical protein